MRDLSVATSVKSYLHACSRLIHQTIASRIPGASSSAICPFSVPRSLSCLVWRLLQCSDTFRLLADCPLVATAVFGLVMAIPALLFLACLHIKFTRVHLHVLRTHLQRCRHLLRSVLTHFRQPMVTGPSSERKIRKCSCEAKNRTARVVDAWGSNHHSQTTKKARIGHPWRDQTPSCLLCSIQAKVGANCSSCFICGRFAQQTNKASQLMSTAWVIGHTRCQHNRGCHS